MKKNMIWGLVLVLLAVYLVASNLGFAPMVSIVRLVATVLFLAVIIKSIKKRSFFGAFFGLSLIYCLFDEMMYDAFPGMVEISGWIVVLAALLLGAGIDMMCKDVFHKNSSHVSINGDVIDGGFVEDNGQTTSFTSSSVKFSGDNFKFENNFGEASKYVNSESFSYASIENNFGAMNVYMDETTVAESGAMIRVENNFGETNLYLPAGVKVELKQDSAFGNIKVRGTSSNQEGAPVLRIDAESNFGDINIYLK